ncbi:MAG TPA: hypothetical protein DEO84_10295 [candidate division Zixibacteria bacterium]|jgi:uncharacterized membrane protein|nr:hypothetical protein [candidate division Zixibacteria bacterium]HBZ01695.1 hypothetical protein [candidate division Zixibacteria bacterium]
MLNRPKLDIPRSPLENTLALLSIVGVILCVYLPWRYWGVLPDRIPTHFDFAGKPNGWGSKGALLILPIIEFVLFMVLSIVQRFPEVYNYPVKITEANARRQYTLARSLLAWLSFEIVWFFTYIEWKSIQAALGQTQGLGPVAVVALMVTTMGTTVYYIRLSHQAK